MGPVRIGRLRLPSLRGTPGRLTAALVVLVALGLATGAVGLIGVRQRADQVEHVSARTGRLAVAAQNLYRALSDADATAASAFLSNGLEPPQLRQRYETDIGEATVALSTVAGGAADAAGIAGAAARITAHLPLYTGLVETARVYNRQGLPLGAAYLREASGLMRTTLLPAARDLYTRVAGRVDEARSGAAAFPWFAVALGLVTLAALGWTQRYLTRRTNRVLNLGLLAATVGVLALLAWLSATAVGAAARLDASRVHGSAQVDVLSQARIVALNARADEALTLVARGNGAQSEKDFQAGMGQLAGADGAGGLLARARSAATDEATRRAVATADERVRAWRSAHGQLRTLDDSGRYNEAVAAAIGPGPQTTASLFGDLDGVLAQAIEHNGKRFTAETGRAGRTLAGLDIGVAVLALLLSGGAAFGIQRRVAEYR